jgi:hypothetical protein
MTSSNVIQYRIFGNNGVEVGKHYQSLLCRTKWNELLKFSPADQFTIQAWGYDEDDEMWEDNPIKLSDFLRRVNVN